MLKNASIHVCIVGIEIHLLLFLYLISATKAHCDGRPSLDVIQEVTPKSFKFHLNRLALRRNKVYCLLVMDDE